MKTWGILPFICIPIAGIYVMLCDFILLLQDEGQAVTTAYFS